MAGILSTSFAYISFPIIYIYIFNDHFNLSFAISFILNFIVSYFLYKYLAFNVKRKSIREFIVFCINALLITLIGYTLLKVLIFYLRLEIFVSNIIVVSTSAFLSFVIHKFITFKK